MTTIPFLLPFFFLHLQAEAQAPSFNCKKATTKIETTICFDPQLSALDHQSAELYRTILSETLNNAERDALQKEQRQWVKDRDARCSKERVAECLKKIYTTRVASQKQFAEGIKTRQKNLTPQASAGNDQTSKAWALIKPEKRKDFWDASFVKLGEDRTALSAINSTDRSILLATFKNVGDNLQLIAKVEEALDAEDVEPEQAVLMDAQVDPAYQHLSSKNETFGLRAIYNYDSTATHCSTAKLFVFTARGSQLKDVFGSVLSTECDGDPDPPSTVQMGLTETAGFRDLIVKNDKKTVVFRWNGDSYSEKIPARH